MKIYKSWENSITKWGREVRLGWECRYLQAYLHCLRVEVEAGYVMMPSLDRIHRASYMAYRKGDSKLEKERALLELLVRLKATYDNPVPEIIVLKQVINRITEYLESRYWPN